MHVETNVEERKLSLSCSLTLKLKITELSENFVNVHVYNHDVCEKNPKENVL